MPVSFGDRNISRHIDLDLGWQHAVTVPSLEIGLVGPSFLGDHSFFLLILVDIVAVGWSLPLELSQPICIHSFYMQLVTVDSPVNREWFQSPAIHSGVLPKPSYWRDMGGLL